MINLMLLAINQREQLILKMAFEQKSISIILSQPSYANYVQTLQYQPDIIVIELPRIHVEQLHFSNLIRKNKKTKKIPIIGYGDKTDEIIKRAITKNGINTYLERPLKFSILITTIEKYLKTINKGLSQTSDKSTPNSKESDIVAILDPATLPVKKIELMVKHISGIMAFPFTVTKVLQITDNEKTGVNDLAKIIEADPVITATLLKVANSVFFASLNRRISSIKDAIIRIGFKETKRVVMSITVMSTFNQNTNNMGFNRMNFWFHQLASGIIAERLAKYMNIAKSDDVFLSGLLHDFGIILLDEFFPSIFQKIIQSTTENATRFVDNEVKLLKITHNDVVKELFVHWKLPEFLIDAIGNHYTILNQKDMCQSNPDAKISLCTALGNILSKSFHLGISCDCFVTLIEDWVNEHVKAQPHILETQLYEKVINDLKLYQQFLNITIDSAIDEIDRKKICIVTLGNKTINCIENYLKVQGHEIVSIPEQDNYSSYHNKFDVVFVMAPQVSSLEKLQGICSIIKHQTDPSQSTNETLDYAKVIAFVRKDNTLLTQKNIPQNLVFVENEFDLRRIDEFMAS